MFETYKMLGSERERELLAAAERANPPVGTSTKRPGSSRLVLARGVARLLAHVIRPVRPALPSSQDR